MLITHFPHLPLVLSFFFLIFLVTHVVTNHNPGKRSPISSKLAVFPITLQNSHDDVIKWKHLPRYWLLVRGIHRSQVNFPHKGKWRGALVFSLICTWTNSWRRRWFQTPSRLLWRHFNECFILNRIIWTHGYFLGKTLWYYLISFFGQQKMHFMNRMQYCSCVDGHISERRIFFTDTRGIFV